MSIEDPFCHSPTFQPSDMQLCVNQLLDFTKKSSDCKFEEMQHILQCLQALSFLPCEHQDTRFCALYDFQNYLKMKSLFFHEETDKIHSICLSDAISILLVKDASFHTNHSLRNSFKKYFLEEMKPNGELYLKLKELNGNKR
ncbi:MAG TPA: hypothetical protein VLG49_02270 [Rhabdochlamydiaceae bacterium]|nr:hypothetical protein [Rhabdochlamydiaceae bacterium]